MPVDPSYKTVKFPIRISYLGNVPRSKFQFQVTQQINCFVNSMINSTLTKKNLQELIEKGINVSVTAIMHAM